ncbi:MAG: alpha/beta fold hydrolase [Solirubrobacterales bacterium]
MKMSDATREAIAIHQAAGRRFEAGGVRSFAREAGRGGTVVLLHGVPTSSFLYRKVVPAVAAQGLHAVAFDFPGLGLAERPEDFDYSWSGLASWTGEAIDALGIDRCHLVVHDIAGPIGLEWAIRNPDRVLSVTALNTLLNVATFKRPWAMQPFSKRVIGELWLAALQPSLGAQLFYMEGIEDRSATPRHEVQAHIHLLKHSDRGRAFLRIMRGFELTAEKQRFLWEGLADRQWPARIVWGERDRALGLDHLAVVEQVLGVDDTILLPARHFLQEDQAPAIANAIGDLAAPLG